MAMIGMFLGGIIAGWTIENTAVTLNLIVISYALYAWKKQNLQQLKKQLQKLKQER